MAAYTVDILQLLLPEEPEPELPPTLGAWKAPFCDFCDAPLLLTF